MNCSLCPNRYKEYFRCTTIIQKDLFSFTEGNNSINNKPDDLVLELLKISCGRK